MTRHPNVLFTGGRLVDPANESVRRADLRVREGKIAEAGEDLQAEGEYVIDCTDRFISPGWMDMHVHLREPGYEHKETIKTGCEAAAFGGFTTVACMPNTDPPIHTRDVVEFIIERASGTPVDVHPIACVSKEREGKELAEMADMKAGGAVAFSDDGSPVYDAGLMRRALEYASMLDCPIINHMEDLQLNPDGHMHEGTVSSRLGIPGIPGASEDVMVARDLILAEVTGAQIHVAHISTARSVELVRRAKADGVRVTAEVCPHHFTLTDEEVVASSFSTNTKMHPPLRGAADVAAVRAGLIDGTIDAICTDHAPHAAFEKEVEFLAAPNGIIGLETAWGVTCRELVASEVLTLMQIIRALTVAPREILRVDIPSLTASATASLTVFDTTTDWTFERRHVKSRSANSPFLGSPMVGKAWAIYNDGQLVQNDL